MRVVELTQALAAPRASVLLGDFGAVFIKVERPGAGALSSAGPASLK
ncbi:MAG: CoA transferase [Candidatus Acidiferrum sp.]